MTRKQLAAPPHFAEKFGYSQASRIGDMVAVSATAPRENLTGDILGQGDVYQQSMQVLKNLTASLEAVGATVNDVIRTRIYITNMEHLWDIGRAHQQVFGEINPATSLLHVDGFFDPDVLVEMEVDAYLGE
ncbi:MAG: Rid family hydrolase [Gammaproteobacteria bacterium]